MNTSCNGANYSPCNIFTLICYLSFSPCVVPKNITGPEAGWARTCQRLGSGKHGWLTLWNSGRRQPCLGARRQSLTSPSPLPLAGTWSYLLLTLVTGGAGGLLLLPPQGLQDNLEVDAKEHILALEQELHNAELDIPIYFAEETEELLEPPSPPRGRAARQRPLPFMAKLQKRLDGPGAAVQEEEVNMKFAELVEELDSSAPNKAAMLSLPMEKKWQIWASRRGATEESSTGLSSNPEDYTARLQELAMLHFPPSMEELEGWAGRTASRSPCGPSRTASSPGSWRRTGLGVCSTYWLGWTGTQGSQ